MSRRKSPYVCRRCGLPVCRWLNGWKHVANGNSFASCKQPPLPIQRDLFNAIQSLRRSQ